MLNVIGELEKNKPTVLFLSLIHISLVVFFAYWMLGRKKMNSTRVTLLLVVVGILAYNLKIFA